MPIFHVYFFNAFRMKNLMLIIFLFSAFVNTLFSQIHIGPSIGINRNHVEAIREVSPSGVFQIYSDNPDISPMFGIKIEFPLSNKLFLSYQSYYYQSKFSIYDQNIIPRDPVGFKSVQSSIIVNRILFKEISIGCGIHFTHISDFFEFHPDRTPSLYIYQNKTKANKGGILFSFGYQLKGFVFNLDYDFYLKKRKQNLIEPINMLQLQLSYLFNTKIKFNKKSKINCPRF